ncbi:MAG: four helix bundle protein [bacterium]
MSTAKKFEDLKVWQLARELVNSIYTMTNITNFKKDFSLKDQIRRSSVSVMANISEGFARQSSKEFAQYLNIAHASVAEVQSHLYIAIDLNYIQKIDFEELYSKCNEISKMLHGLYKYLITNSKLSTYNSKPKR